MKKADELQISILDRFMPIGEVPCQSTYYNHLKKMIILKNIFSQVKCLMKIQPAQVLQQKQRNILHQASFLQKLQGHLGIPLMLWSGQDFDCLVLVVEQLGYTLNDRMLIRKDHKSYRLKDVCMAINYIIDIVRNLHQKGYLCRNITPETFQFGKGPNLSKIYLNDMLHMKKYQHQDNNTHIQMKKNNRMEFLTPFLSLNVLKRQEPSRRDDIISIIYVMIYLLKSKLPWQQDWEEQISLKKQQILQKRKKDQSNIFFKDFQNKLGVRPQKISSKLNRVRQIHQNISQKQLCRGLPSQIEQLLNLASDLQFAQQPQYQRYKALIKKILFKNKLKNDGLYEWMQNIKLVNNQLKLNTNIVNLQLRKDQYILQAFYYPYQKNVDVDPIATMLEQSRQSRKQIANSNNIKAEQNLNCQNQVRRNKNIHQISRNNQKCQVI